MTDATSETQARIDLAAALRWAAKLGFGEGICNHFSIELPDRSTVPVSRSRIGWLKSRIGAKAGSH